jgi:hypothetical protein
MQAIGQNVLEQTANEFMAGHGRCASDDLRFL